MEPLTILERALALLEHGVLFFDDYADYVEWKDAVRAVLADAKGDTSILHDRVVPTRPDTSGGDPLPPVLTIEQRLCGLEGRLDVLRCRQDTLEARCCARGAGQ